MKMLLEFLDWARKTLSAAQLCWMCLAATFVIGYVLATQYVRADDFKELKSRVDLSTQLQLAAEIRAQTSICRAVQEKEAVRRIIEQLQSEYRKITGERYPESPCQ